MTCLDWLVVATVTVVNVALYVATDRLLKRVRRDLRECRDVLEGAKALHNLVRHYLARADQ